MVSETAEFYKNKNIFITGGTGFLGIALIEKVLRATPTVIILFDLFSHLILLSSLNFALKYRIHVDFGLD